MGRARQLLESQQAALGEVIARLAAVEAQLAEALARTDALGHVQALAEDGLARATNAQTIAEDALARGVDGVGKGTDALARATNAQTLAEDALRRSGAAEGQGQDAAATAAVALDTAREALLPARMAAFAAWLELCPPAAGPAISVVLPTHDRPELLPRAVASVMEQEYESWELLIVDDGETDAVAGVLAEVEDERIAVVDGPRRGPGAARNAGLEAAQGEVVCYLDDDNAMHPRWLLAVACVFGSRDDVDVAYGVTVAEHRIRGTLEPDGWWPSFWQLPWSREKLLEENLTDTGALAHRRTLPEAHFDEELGDDWDLLIRLTADRPALAIPAISHAYTMEGDDHVSRTAEHEAGLEQVRRRHVGE